MSKLREILASIRVIATAAPTYLVAAALAVTVVRDEISKAFPDSADQLVHWTTPILAGLTAAVAIIRRVTPVYDKNERGVLEQDNEF